MRIRIIVVIFYALAAGRYNLLSDTWALWDIAKRFEEVHRYSTLFTAQDVRQFLSTEQGIQEAIDWCRTTGVTKVYLETFRDGYRCPSNIILRAKNAFLGAGFRVSGCITTTQLGKASTGWKTISCYSDPATQKQLADLFRYTASMFDEIMIDDFFFTDCRCEVCDQCRQQRMVRIGDKTWTVTDASWESYFCELMYRVSEVCVLGASREVNPSVKIIIKYPQWYDRFHERGYNVGRQTQLFDRIWVGTETRDYHDVRWGGFVQYGAFFIMRWLGGIGGEKCGGGWFDWLGTSPSTYVEQARQTILGGARESLLFCYGGLHRDKGPQDIEALRQNIPELLQVAKQVSTRKLRGVAVYKPIDSPGRSERRVFDFIGMLGIPCVPTHVFPGDAPAIFLSIHATKDPNLVEELHDYFKTGRPVLMTDGLASELRKMGVSIEQPQVIVVPVHGDPKRLLQLSLDELEAIRRPVLSALGVSFSAPVGVALYLFDDESWVIENFTDEQVRAQLNEMNLIVPARGWTYRWR